MVVLSVISFMVSFLLQGLMSNFFNYTINGLSIFSTIYLVVSIVVLKQYFEDEKRVMILLIVFGLFSDIVYSNTALLNVFIFIILFYFNKLLSSFLPYNIVMINLFSILSIILYHLITFFFLTILSFDNFSFCILLKVICCNLIMTILYTSFLYIIIDRLYNRFDLKIIRD